MDRPLAEYSAEELAAAGLRAFFQIANAWGLDDDESRALLGSPTHEVFEGWRAGAIGEATPELLVRIGHVLGIHRASTALLGDMAAVRTWLRGPNLAPGFDGTSPMECLTRGSVDDLAAVRGYLARHLDGEW